MLPTAAQLVRAVPALSEARAQQIAQPLRETCARYEIDTTRRVAAFLAQCGHESASFSRVVENLNYSAEGLLGTWPSRFDAATAAEYARRPEAIANRVYGGRMGNGDESSGDGWRYRGRGWIQCTGHANYAAMTELLRSQGAPDFVAEPELLESPLWAARTAGAYWDDHELNALADAGDLGRMTRIINGGVNGQQDRIMRYSRALRVLMQDA